MSEATQALIRASDIWKSYAQERVTVLKGVSLEVQPGELVALWGSSGSGKSTLLHLLGGLDLPDKGNIEVCGLNPQLEEDRLVLRRRHLGFIFQLHNLIPDLSIEENVRVPALAVGRSKRETADRVRQLVESVGLGHRFGHRIQELSGGERQRVAICRALCNEPQVLLADEPTGSLDEKTGDSVFQLLRELAEKNRIAVVLATHERRFAEACDRRVHLRDGRVET